MPWWGSLEAKYFFFQHCLGLQQLEVFDLGGNERRSLGDTLARLTSHPPKTGPEKLSRKVELHELQNSMVCRSIIDFLFVFSKMGYSLPLRQSLIGTGQFDGRAFDP